MKLFLITDSADAYEGLRMTGIDGVVVADEAEATAAIAAAAEDSTVAVLLVTKGLAQKVQGQLLPFQLRPAPPLVLEIPDPHSDGGKGGSMTRYVKETLGLEL